MRTHLFLHATPPLHQAEESSKAPELVTPSTNRPLGPRLYALKAQASAPSSAAPERDEGELRRALILDLLSSAQNLALENPDSLRLIFTQIYGARGISQGRTLLEAAAHGEFPLPARVEFVDAAVLNGGEAAYSGEDGGIVFLSRALGRDTDRLEAAFHEEVGHHLDRILGGTDAIGDEGQLFALAVREGRPLTTAELRSGRIDRDQAVIQIHGRSYDVELRTDAESRIYEARTSFNQLDRRGAAEERLQRDTEKAIIARYSTLAPDAVHTIEDVRAYCLAHEIDFDVARLKEENVIVQLRAQNPVAAVDVDANLITTYQGQIVDGHPVRSIEDVKSHLTATGISFDKTRAEAERTLLAPHRELQLETLGSLVAEEAYTAVTLARLVKGGILPEGTALSSALSAEVQALVRSDAALSLVNPPIKTHGALIVELLGDVDGDRMADIDALQLARFLPGGTQQKILRAIKADVASDELVDRMRGVGFESSLLRSAAGREPLTLIPPPGFGLAGATEIDRIQQQLLLRTGRIFLDSNKDGRVDDQDRVSWTDATGAVHEATFGELSDELKVLAEYNLAVAKACEAYAALPHEQRMKFPHYQSAIGESEPEAANELFWEVGTADANYGQTSWLLKPGCKPSAAIDDVFTGGGAKYTTECAHARTTLRLKGLKNYSITKYGQGPGTERFDARLAKTAEERTRAEDHAKGFDGYLAAHAGATWEDYVRESPEPEITYGLEVSRHVVLGADEAVLDLWDRTSDVESAAGDTGYFHNYSVSVEGVKIGYVGENVIDLGYKNGVRMYWGHPGGIQAEDRWQHELASNRIMVHSMSEYEQYFSPLDMKRDAARLSRTRVEGLEKQVAKLRVDQPQGFEAQIKELEGTIGWWRALGEVRGVVAEQIDVEKLAAAEDFFSNNANLETPDHAAPLVDALTAEGRATCARAFDVLGEEAKRQTIAHFSVPNADALTEIQKAQAAVLVSLTAGGTRLHPELAKEGLQALKNREFAKLSPLLGREGSMGSKENFAAWLKTDAFKTWYQEKAQEPYTGETDLAALTTEDVTQLVEFAFPMTAGMRTVYADVNRGAQRLSEQMATLLKDGRLPEAEYALDSPPVAPIA